MQPKNETYFVLKVHLFPFFFLPRSLVSSTWFCGEGTLGLSTRKRTCITHRHPLPIQAAPRLLRGCEWSRCGLWAQFLIGSTVTAAGVVIIFSFPSYAVGVWIMDGMHFGSDAWICKEGIESYTLSYASHDLLLYESLFYALKIRTCVSAFSIFIF